MRRIALATLLLVAAGVVSGYTYLHPSDIYDLIAWYRLPRKVRDTITYDKLVDVHMQELDKKYGPSSTAIFVGILRSGSVDDLEAKFVVRYYFGFFQGCGGTGTLIRTEEGWQIPTSLGIVPIKGPPIVIRKSPLKISWAGHPTVSTAEDFLRYYEEIPAALRLRSEDSDIARIMSRVDDRTSGNR